MEYQKLILKMTALAAGQTSMWLLTESYLRITRDGAAINDILSSYRSLTQTDLLAIKKVTNTPEIVEPFESFFEALNWYLQTKIGSGVTRKLSSWAAVADFWEECGRFEAYIKVKQIFVKLGLAYEDDVCGRGFVVSRVSLAAEFYKLTITRNSADDEVKIMVYVDNIRNIFNERFKSTETFSKCHKGSVDLLSSEILELERTAMTILAELDNSVRRAMSELRIDECGAIEIMRMACIYAMGFEPYAVFSDDINASIKVIVAFMSSKLLRAIKAE